MPESKQPSEHHTPSRRAVKVHLHQVGRPIDMPPPRTAFGRLETTDGRRRLTRAQDMRRRCLRCRKHPRNSITTGSMCVPADIYASCSPRSVPSDDGFATTTSSSPSACGCRSGQSAALQHHPGRRSTVRRRSLVGAQGPERPPSGSWSNPRSRRHQLGRPWCLVAGPVDGVHSAVQ